MRLPGPVRWLHLTFALCTQGQHVSFLSSATIESEKSEKKRRGGGWQVAPPPMEHISGRRDAKRESDSGGHSRDTLDPPPPPRNTPYPLPGVASLPLPTNAMSPAANGTGITQACSPPLPNCEYVLPLKNNFTVSARDAAAPPDSSPS